MIKRLDSRGVVACVDLLVATPEDYRGITQVMVAKSLSAQTGEDVRVGHMPRLVKDALKDLGEEGPWQYSKIMVPVKEKVQPESEGSGDDTLDLLEEYASAHEEIVQKLYFFLRQQSKRINELISINNGLEPYKYKCMVEGKYHLHHLITDPLHEVVGRDRLDE